MKKINMDRIMKKAIGQLALYSTVIFVAIIFLFELLTRDVRFFSLYLTVVFVVSSAIISYSLYNSKKALTQQRAFSFSVIMGGLFVVIALLFPSTFNIFGSIPFPVLKIGLEKIAGYVIILWLFGSVSYYGALKVRGM